MSMGTYHLIVLNKISRALFSKDPNVRYDAVPTENKKPYKVVSILVKGVEAVIGPVSDLPLARSSFYV